MGWGGSSHLTQPSHVPGRVGFSSSDPPYGVGRVRVGSGSWVGPAQPNYSRSSIARSCSKHDIKMAAALILDKGGIAETMMF